MEHSDGTTTEPVRKRRERGSPSRLSAEGTSAAPRGSGRIRSSRARVAPRNGHPRHSAAVAQGVSTLGRLGSPRGSAAAPPVVVDLLSSSDPEPAVGDDDECVVMPPPSRPTFIVQTPRASGASELGDGGDGDSGDGEVCFVGTGRSAILLPHARYDCFEFPLGRGADDQHCGHCWCGTCERPVAECRAWPEHCGVTQADAEARRRAERQEALKKRLAEAARPPAPAPDSAHAQLAADVRWPSMRYTVLSWLRNCGADLEGAMATVWCAPARPLALPPLRAPPIPARAHAVLRPPPPSPPPRSSGRLGRLRRLGRLGILGILGILSTLAARAE